ncbi:MAG: hypothetical protein ACETWM_12885 [Candidatus Lokiarchaeia archaeon]
MRNYVILEVDLPIHPYQGILGCFQTHWSSWLEPQYIYFFTRDSPISYEIHPGDIILCEESGIYSCDAGKVIMPVKKFTAEELVAYLKNNPEIEIRVWDLTSNKESPLHIAKDFFKLLKTLEAQEGYSAATIRNLISMVSQAVKMPGQQFVFPQIKIKVLECILEELDPALTEKVIETLGSKVRSLPADQLFGFIFPRLQVAAPEYLTRIDLRDKIGEDLGLPEEKTVIQKLQEVLLEDFNDWLKTKLKRKRGTENIDLKWLAGGNFSEIKNKILQDRVSEAESSPIYVRGETIMEYDVSSLKNTVIGKRLFDSLKISEEKTWVDQSMFNLIQAALRRFGIKLKLLKSSSNSASKQD